jgi:hypothetical protein
MVIGNDYAVKIKVQREGRNGERPAAMNRDA